MADSTSSNRFPIPIHLPHVIPECQLPEYLTCETVTPPSDTHIIPPLDASPFTLFQVVRALTSTARPGNSFKEDVNISEKSGSKKEVNSKAMVPMEKALSSISQHCWGSRAHFLPRMTSFFCLTQTLSANFHQSSPTQLETQGPAYIFSQECCAL